MSSEHYQTVQATGEAVELTAGIVTTGEYLYCRQKHEIVHIYIIYTCDR